MTNLTIQLINGDTKEVRVVGQYKNGRLCYDNNKGVHHVVDNNEDVELDMDVTEVITGIKPWSCK
jgi:hypothetical protein